MGHKRLIPVVGVHLVGLDTDGSLVEILDQHERSEVVVALDIARNDVVSHKTVERVLAVGQRIGAVGQCCVKRMVCLIDIVGIRRVVERACQVVELLQHIFIFVTADIVLLLKNTVGSDEKREAFVLLLWHSRHLFPEVRSIGVGGIGALVIGVVLDILQRVNKTSSLEGSREVAYFGIVLHYLCDRAVGVFQDHIDWLHHTVLHRVVLSGKIDLGHTVEPYFRVAFLVVLVGYLDVTAVHIGGMKRAVDHLNGGVHVVDQVGARDSVALFVGQVVNRLYAALLVEGLERTVGRKEQGVVAVCGKQVHHVGTLDHRGEVFILRTVVYVVAHHLARKGVEVVAVGFVRAADETRSANEAADREHQIS